MEEKVSQEAKKEIVEDGKLFTKLLLKKEEAKEVEENLEDAAANENGDELINFSEDELEIGDRVPKRESKVIHL